MTDTITRNNLFRPVPSKAQSKADLTDSTARALIKAEADSRQAKSQRLRQARLEMEARQPKPAPTKARAAKKAKGVASRRAV
ncbi:hypothetical protein [Nitratireductor sp. GCM10026969]|uniref:hypothetical protein n=1 Tax=Nitratireductor sp. GCM10026969 TaxID=3252645 RepID=UPI00361398A0